MSAIRTLIVDDVALARERVRHYLAGEADIEIVGEAASGADALRRVNELKPQLLFLDVALPDLDGFTVAARLPHESRPVVIFLTAHDDRAVEAFEAQALDYLVKPVDSDRFARALMRARAQLRLMAGETAPASEFVTALTIRDGSRTEIVATADIDYIDVAGHYLCVHVGRTVHLVRGSLSDLESQLDPTQFARVHRSAIVRLGRVKSLSARRNGDADIALTTGAKLVLSRTYAPHLKRRLPPGEA